MAVSVIWHLAPNEKCSECLYVMHTVHNKTLTETNAYTATIKAKIIDSCHLAASFVHVEPGSLTPLSDTTL